MSYCRFGMSSDVYCYANMYGGYTTHVAGNRLHGTPPDRPSIHAFARGEMTAEEYVERNSAFHKWCQTADRKPIGLPHDGASFDDSGPHEALARLESLRADGYLVPDCALESLREEVADLREKLK